VKGLPVSSPTRFLVITFILTFPAIWSIGDVEARSSFSLCARDKNARIISAVVQYNTRLEARILLENVIDIAVLQIEISLGNRIIEAKFMK